MTKAEPQEKQRLLACLACADENLRQIEAYAQHLEKTSFIAEDWSIRRRLTGASGDFWLFRCLKMERVL